MKYIVLIAICLFTKFSFGQIEFYYFKEEIDLLKSKKKIAKYWKELYKMDRDNISLKIPMDSMSIINRLKAAYLIQQHGFPDPAVFGKNSALTLLGLHAHNPLIDVNAMTFFQIALGNEKKVWLNTYPNYPMSVMLFWYNGSEVTLDQEFALALRILEKPVEKELNMDYLCKLASDFLKIRGKKNVQTIGQWQMSFPSGVIPLSILKYEKSYYLKKGKSYFLLDKKKENVFSFHTELDKTNLYIFESGELVLRDMYDRELGVYPMLK